MAQQVEGRGAGFHIQAKHSPTSPAGKRLYGREKALGKWCLVAASLPVCRTSWEPFSSPGAKRHCLTANSPAPFPSLPKSVGTTELPVSSRHCPQPVAKHCLGGCLSAPASTSEAEPSVARLVPPSCFISWYRHSQEVLTRNASLGLGGLH